MPRDVWIAALESARDLLLGREREDPDLAARLYLELGGAMPLGGYTETALALTTDAELRAVAHAFIAHQRFDLGPTTEAWAHVEAGLAAAVRLTSSDEPDRGDAVALEVRSAVGFSDAPEAAAAHLAALGLAAFYDEDRCPPSWLPSWSAPGSGG